LLVGYFFLSSCLLFLPGVGVDLDPPTYASHIAWTTVVRHVGCDGVFLIFCLVWPGTAILPISASHIAGIIAMSHCTQLLEIFLDKDGR
jgi:hypothetical protein